MGKVNGSAGSSVLHLNTLIKFPFSAYEDFNKGIGGLAVVDSITLEGEGDQRIYNANISIPVSTLSECLSNIKACNATVVDMTPQDISPSMPKVSAARMHRMKGGKTIRKVVEGSGKKKTLVQLLMGALSTEDFQTVPQLASKTGMDDGRVHVRLAEIANRYGLKKKKIEGRTAYALEKKLVR